MVFLIVGKGDGLAYEPRGDQKSPIWLVGDGVSHETLQFL